MSSKGFWRNAWKVDLSVAEPAVPRGGASSPSGPGSVVLKSLKYVHDPDGETFELGRVDAVSLDVLTGSRHTIDVFGHCGTTSVQEYAGGDLKRLLPKLGHRERLEVAVMIAEGVADVHSVGGGRNGTVSLVHNDVSLGCAHLWFSCLYILGGLF